MSITASIIRRPVTILICFLILTGLSAYMLPNIAVNMFPETTMPRAMVRTTYTGAGPEEIEQNVTKVLEKQLSNVSNLVSITSTSSEGSSMITLEFTYSTDMDKVVNDIRDKLENADNLLPDGASSPSIFKFDPSSQPILNLVVKGDRTPEELHKIATDDIQPKIERITGVSATSVRGGREKVIRVEISQNRLEAYDLTLAGIASSLASQNIRLGAGELGEGDRIYNISTNGEFVNVDEIGNAVIAIKTAGAGSSDDGKTSVIPVRLRDIADVFEGYSDETTVVYINGKPGIYISVQKESGTNSSNVALRVKKQIPVINKVLPEGITLEIISDSTEQIRATINEIYNSLLQGIFLAMAVLLLILRNWKSTVIIGVSIPLSIMITVMFMFFFNITLNMMTLSGLVLAIGMVVDCSIVIIENIFRYRERGTNLKSAALLGTREMIVAITASTITTVCVFVPIIIFKNNLEMIGQLFNELGFTIIIALLSSLVIAITLVPVLASSYLKLYSRKQKPLKNGILKMLDKILERGFVAMESGYKKGISFALKHKTLVVILVLVLLALTAQRFISLGINMYPMMSEDSVTVSVELPVGTALSRTTSILQDFQQIIEKEIRGYDQLILTSGNGGGFMATSSSNKGSIEIVLPGADKQIDSMFVIQQKLRKHFNDYPDVTFSFDSGRFRIGNTNPVDIIVRSDDLDKAKDVATKIRDLLKANCSYVTEPEIDLEEGLPAYNLVIDRERSYSLGISIQAIANEIHACMSGTVATQYRSGGDEMDVLVILKPDDRESIPDLEKIYVMGSSGQQIKISNIARFRETTGTISINREDERRTVHVSGGLVTGFAVSTAEREIRLLVSKNIVADEEVSILFGGDFADIQNYGSQLVIIIIMAVILVFGVMASLFESWLDPFIIFLTIPLMFIGVVWIYAIIGSSFSLMSAVGLVLLVGVVVNNGIVLVDYTNLLRARGRTIFDACVEAGGNRLRPIIMTSVTTILGTVPMAFFPGKGSEMVQPIGQTIVGGMLVSTVMTLFFTPVLYAIFNHNHKNNRKKEEETEMINHLAGGVKI